MVKSPAARVRVRVEEVQSQVQSIVVPTGEESKGATESKKDSISATTNSMFFASIVTAHRTADRPHKS